MMDLNQSLRAKGYWDQKILNETLKNVETKRKLITNQLRMNDDGNVANWINALSGKKIEELPKSN